MTIMRNTYEILVGRVLRPRRKWQDITKMNAMSIGYGGAEWIPLVPYGTK
jgi:hypothetical protein